MTVASPQDYATDAEISLFNRGQSYSITPLRSRGLLPVKAAQRVMQLLRIALSTQPDVVLASGNRAVWMCAPLCALFRWPWVAVGHGIEFGLRSGWRAQLTRRAYSAATAVVCVSEHTRKKMESMGVRNSHSSVIHNGADDTCFRILPENDVARIRLNLGLTGKHVLLTAGRVTDRKGQDVVIRALPHIQRYFPGTHYVMAGLPERKEEYSQLARELGVDQSVHFLGRVDEEALLGLMNCCDLFVMTSRNTSDGDFEGFGIAAVEAALCGTPAVVSSNSGLTEAIIDGETGVTVPQNDPVATAQAIIRLLSDEAKLRSMGKAARDRATREQTWAKRVVRYETLLSSLVAGPRSGSKASA